MASAYFKKPRVNISAMSLSRCATTVGHFELPYPSNTGLIVQARLWGYLPTWKGKQKSGFLAGWTNKQYKPMMLPFFCVDKWINIGYAMVCQNRMVYD